LASLCGRDGAFADPCIPVYSTVEKIHSQCSRNDYTAATTHRV